MTTRKFLIIPLFLGLALGLAACGKDAATTVTSWDTITSGFRVINSDPYPNTENVPIASDIKILFSNGLDTTTIDGNIMIYETANGSTKDWTSNCTVSYASTNTTNDTYICSHAAKSLNPNGKYQVTISTSVKSTSGESLVAYTAYIFATGSLTSVNGSISVDGPPQVTSWILYSDASSDCVYYAQIAFNEDLQAIPQAHYRAIQWVGGSAYETGIMGVYVNPNSSNMRSFLLYFPNSCNPSYFSYNNKLEITIDEAIDLTGDVTSGVAHTFTANGFSIQ